MADEAALDRDEALADAIVEAGKGLAFGDFIDGLDLALHRLFAASMTHLVNLEQLRLLRDVHAVTVGKAPASDNLVRAARDVVLARYAQGDWSILRDAIGVLEDLVGRPKDEG
jgi:hypothetical protein